jgi:hypothetical protein
MLVGDSVVFVVTILVQLSLCRHRDVVVRVSDILSVFIGARVVALRERNRWLLAVVHFVEDFEDGRSRIENLGLHLRLWELRGHSLCACFHFLDAGRFRFTVRLDVVPTGQEFTELGHDPIIGLFVLGDRDRNEELTITNLRYIDDVSEPLGVILAPVVHQRRLV